MISKYLSKIVNNDVGTKNLTNRERWLKSTLSKIPRGKKIIDAGAGELQYKKYCKHLQYTSQDFGEYDGAGNSVGLQTQSWDNSKIDILSDITKIPVDGSSFDAVMCIEVFEHIPDPIKALKEFRRILKKSGYLIITAPVASITHFAPYYFYNGFSRYWYEKFLDDFGFEIIDLNFNGNWFEAIAQEIRRIPQVISTYDVPTRLTAVDKLAMIKLLRVLNKASAADIDSHELDSHGIHVFAKKK